MPDEPSKGQPTGWTPTSENDHFMECPVCGQMFDCRDIRQAMAHFHDFPLNEPPTRRH